MDLCGIQFTLRDKEEWIKTSVRRALTDWQQTVDDQGQLMIKDAESWKRWFCDRLPLDSISGSSIGPPLLAVTLIKPVESSVELSKVGLGGEGIKVNKKRERAESSSACPSEEGQVPTGSGSPHVEDANSRGNRRSKLGPGVSQAMHPLIESGANQDSPVAGPRAPGLASETHEDNKGQPTRLLYKHVWQNMSSVMSAAFAGFVQGRRLLLVYGGSGAGKTKLFYDLGRYYVFAVIVPVQVGTDADTRAWRFIEPLLSFFHAEQGPGARETMQTIILHYINSHIEWAVGVAEEAAKDEESLRCVAEKHHCSRIEALRLICLQSQRNSFSCNGIQSILVSKIRQLESSLNYDYTRPLVWDDALAEYLRLYNRALEVERSVAKEAVEQPPDSHSVLLFFDEAQVLAGRELPADVYGVRETYLRLLLSVIRTLSMQRENVLFTISGSRVSLTEQLFKESSPAQGISLVQNVFTPLDLPTLKKFLGQYVTQAKLDLMEDATLSMFCGRPLYAATLLETIFLNITPRQPNPDVDSVLGKALFFLRWDTRARVSRAWRRTDTLHGSDESAHSLLTYLYFQRRMGYSSTWIGSMTSHSTRALLDDAVFLAPHCHHDSKQLVNFEEEPATAEALLWVGDQHSIEEVPKKDEVCHLINRCASGTSSLLDSKGVAAEHGIAWHFYRKWSKHLRRNPESAEMPLSELLGDVRPVSFKATILSEYTVSFADGFIPCKTDMGHTELLNQLVSTDGTTKRVRRSLLHSLPGHGATSDIVFPIKHRHTEQFRLLLVQVKNSTARISESLPLLDISNWFQGQGTVVDELLNQAGSPVRAFCNARGYSEALLDYMMYFNEILCPAHPLLPMHMTEENLGMDLRTDTNEKKLCNIPDNYHNWWPKQAKAFMPTSAPAKPSRTIQVVNIQANVKKAEDLHQDKPAGSTVSKYIRRKTKRNNDWKPTEDGVFACHIESDNVWDAIEYMKTILEDGGKPDGQRKSIQRSVGFFTETRRRRRLSSR
eukprot:gb/GECG01016572.1/.p1 GENE.gb/GECG01016572.1/~~gb/GECG01016572.1/.p1  ORF type:complete len:1004 (+),score=94.86 gb/GECG01016572.1/:1-3012(+)